MFFDEIINKNNSNIIFLTKERTYTKLKYSRAPQADIVSGGVAALFAAFLGYLISERFGFELIDSGDFYFLIMYATLLIASLRFWVKFEPISLVTIVKPVFNFLKLLIVIQVMFANYLLLILKK